MYYVIIDWSLYVYIMYNYVCCVYTILARRSMCTLRYMISHDRSSVCPSVTRVDHSKTS